MNKRKRKSFKDFKFETTEITYKKEYFDRVIDIETGVEDLIKENIEDSQKTFETGQSILNELIPHLAKYVKGEKRVPFGHPLRDLLKRARKSPDKIDYETLCGRLNLNYEELSSVEQVTADVFIDYFIEDLTERQTNIKEVIAHLEDKLAFIEGFKKDIGNLAKYCQDPERTDLDHLIDIPKSFRDFIIHQTDDWVLKGQISFEKCVNMVKEEEADLKEDKQRLNDLSPIKKKIMKVKIAEKEMRLHNTKTRIKDFKEDLNTLSEIRNYFGLVIESLPGN